MQVFLLASQTHTLPSSEHDKIISAWSFSEGEIAVVVGTVVVVDVVTAVVVFVAVTHGAGTKRQQVTLRSCLVNFVFSSQARSSENFHILTRQSSDALTMMGRVGWNAAQLTP